MEALIVKGMVSAATLYLLLVIFIVYGLKQGQRGTKYTLRKIAAIEALEEIVGRSAETGRPIHASTGSGMLRGSSAPAVLAGLAIIHKACRLAANYKTDVIVTVQQPEVFAATQETVQQAYFAEGKGDLYKPENVRFISPLSMAYVAGAIGTMNREKIAANIIVGAFSGEALLLAEAAARLGAIQIAGSNNARQIPFFVAVCDYTLIGEEMFAAGAYLSDNVAQVGCLRGQDLGKLLAVILLLLGVLTRSMGIKTLTDILAK